jgi:histidinol dehydrogenase
MTSPVILTDRDYLNLPHGNDSPSADPAVQSTITAIQQTIRDQKDRGLIQYAAQFDRVDPSTFQLKVAPDEIDAALARVPKPFLHALKTAHRAIAQYHSYQRPKGWSRRPRKGVSYGLRYTPLDSVGLYVPGGRAIYPSSVLMNAIPAQIAGVSSIVMCTPPQPDGNIPDCILAAAAISGISTIIKSGGAQAIFAMAYGTESVPKVDKIVGPGNKYVDGAKQRVYGVVDIDKPAGPSEVLVYVTDPAYARFAAAELLAQLEHDPDARGVALTLTADCAQAIQSAFTQLLPKCSRQAIIHQSVRNASIVICESEISAIELINHIASEHLVILVDQPETIMTHVRHAGSIFLGPYTPVALGDYIAGPNHVLPTGAAARFSSPLGVMDFLKYSAFCQYTQDALAAIQSTARELTGMEGFDAHQLSIDIRL